MVNVAPDRMIYSYTRGQGLKHFKMNRLQSLIFFLKNLGDNVKLKQAKLLPRDDAIGSMTVSFRPATVPHNAQYLGGVGEGAWFSIRPASHGRFFIKRFTPNGELEYAAVGRTTKAVELLQPIEISYDSHLLFTHVKQNGCIIRIDHIQRLPSGYLFGLKN
ncbi:hypothetical protein D3C80_1371050 [compost metagenome]